MIPKIELKKIKKLPRILGERAFLTFLGLFFISLILGFFIFYKYNILARKTELKTTEKPLQFDEKTFQEVLKFWQEKGKRFQEADFKKYPNPFK